MNERPLILSIDQGTTSSRAIVFSEFGEIIHSAQYEFNQYYPKDGWVEQNPNEIWDSTLKAARRARQNVVTSSSGKLVTLGITNQRETTLLWEAKTSKPIYNAISWQDRRTAEFCKHLKVINLEETIRKKTGLLLDPYFSATKIAWILANVEGAREKAENGKIKFGTADSYLIWKLTDGKCHYTDATNASRTMLFNIQTNDWDDDLLKLFKIPRNILPQVKDSCDYFGETNNQHFGQSLPIHGVAGDQQAAAIGQQCFSSGMSKSTYGTGCFVLMNTGDKIIQSKNKLISTIAYRLLGQSTYALEGSIFNAGTAMQWLRDELGFFKNTSETEAIAQKQQSNNGVYMIPAFTGLGAPHWQPNVRGAILGLTRDSTRNDITRAALESVCYQTHDLLTAMFKDSGVSLNCIRVDGGMTQNIWLLQFLADIINVKVERPRVIETTALGVAILAGLGAGLYKSLDSVGKAWHLDRAFDARMPTKERSNLIGGWNKSINSIKSQGEFYE